MLKWIALLGLGGGAYYFFTQGEREAENAYEAAALQYQAQHGGTKSDAKAAIGKLACQGAGNAYGIPSNLSGPICSVAGKAFSKGVVGAGKGALAVGKGFGKAGKKVGKLFKKIF